MSTVKFFQTPDEFHDRLIELAKQGPVSAQVGTYSVYAGILTDGRDATKWGDKYKNPIHDLFDALAEAKCETQILVGVPNFPTCYDGCPNCKIKKFRMLKRFYLTSKRWPDFEWRFHDTSHLKLVNLTYEDGSKVSVLGGRNLSCSSWEDFSLELPGHPKELVANFQKAWEDGFDPELLKKKVEE